MSNPVIIDSGADDWISAISVQSSNDNIFAAGVTNIGGSNDFALLRFDAHGVLVPGFGTAGIVKANLLGDDWATSMQVLANGSVLLFGYLHESTSFILAKFTSAGALDTSFSGGAGYVSTNIGSYALGTDIAVLADGKILVAGSATTDASPQNIVLARYTANGVLDGTFGTAGVVRTDIGGGFDYANGLLVQADGKILVVGYNSFWYGSYFALVRYTADGQLDTSFGNNGVVTTDISNDSDYAQKVLLQSDGEILVAGYAKSGSQQDIVLTRYTSSGVLDKLVSINIASFDRAYDIALQAADNKMLIAGASGNKVTDSDVVVVRLNADGSRDSGFGTNGVVVTDLGHNASAESITVADDGKIIVGGYVENGSNKDFLLLAYDTTGTLDQSFGTPAASTYELSGTLSFWKTGTAISGASCTMDSESAATTDVSGHYAYQNLSTGSHALSATKSIDTTVGNAIKANDALAALKIAVGLNPNVDGTSVSNYQLLAADVNKDGRITAADALNILKMSVGLGAAPDKEWFFVPGSVANESMDRTSVVWPDVSVTTTLSSDTAVNLVGIVKGDVNGSWLPPT